MSAISFDDLLAALVAEAEGRRVGRKVENIVKRAAVEVRMDWKARATEFPSPTRGRAYDYAIDFDDVHRSRSEVYVEIGSNDPLLEIIEYGTGNHPPHNYGRAAADKATPGMLAALARIDPLAGT